MFLSTVREQQSQGRRAATSITFCQTNKRLAGGLGHSQRWIRVSAEEGERAEHVAAATPDHCLDAAFVMSMSGKSSNRRQKDV